MADALNKVFHEQSGGDPPRAGPKTAAVAGRPPAKKRAPALKSGTGFILMDSTLNPIFMNADATQILSYPDRLVKSDRPAVCTVIKIHSLMHSRQLPDEFPFVTEFRSGRRHYYCRAFRVDSNDNGPSHPSIAVLLERGPSALTPLVLVSERFNLTERERETLEYSLQGLGIKEIANRMNISPNTVKVFVRMIMTKMGVSSRLAIISKMLLIESAS